jgi:phage terminase Nu1 subunit (DNA packaging protein)
VAKVNRKSRIFRTLQAFAETLGQPTTTVSGWVKHPAWAWNRKAPWRIDIIPEVLRWAAANLERGRPARGVSPDDVTGKLKRAKLSHETRKLRANADQAETDLAKSRGLLLDAITVRSQWAAVGVVVRNALENVPAQIVPLALNLGMPHDQASKLHNEVEEIIAAVLRHLSDGGPGRPRPDRPDVLSKPASQD